MKKLTNEQLEILVQKKNAAGIEHVVEVMSNEELALYKNNCLEAIERLEKSIAKNNQGKTMLRIWSENKEVLEGYVVYIDEKLKEQEGPIVKITDMKKQGKKIEITFKGQTVSRTTKRHYTHVVVANAYTYSQSGKLNVLGFCGRHDLAVKKYEEFRKNNITVKTFYDDPAYRKPANYEEIKNKKMWENLQIIELV